MTNNAQLLPLPVAEYRLSPDSKPSLYDADQMQSYALASIEAAKPAGHIRDATKMVDALGSLPVVTEDLAEALADVMSWISNWTPNFIHDPEWDDSRERAVLALATYEAAQGEKE